MARSTTKQQNVNAGDSFAFSVSANTGLIHVVSSILAAGAGADHGGVVVKPVARGLGVLNTPITPTNESAVVYENNTAYKVGTYDVSGWELLDVEVSNDAGTSKDVSIQVYRA
jgi:hypothetical protein